MNEKTLGQIAYEAAWPCFSWIEVAEAGQRKWEQVAKAVADAVRAESKWQPIETAPKDVNILVLYDDGSHEYVEAEDNTLNYEPYQGKRPGITYPMHFMLIPPLEPKP